MTHNLKKDRRFSMEPNKIIENSTERRRQSEAAETIQKAWKNYKNEKKNAQTLHQSMNQDVQALKCEITKLTETNTKLKTAVIGYKKEVKHYKKMLTKLQSKVNAKNSHIAALRSSIVELDHELAVMVKKPQHKSNHTQNTNKSNVKDKNEISNLKRKEKSLEKQEKNAISALKGHKQLKTVLNEQIKLMQQNLESLLKEQTPKKLTSPRKASIQSKINDMVTQLNLLEHGQKNLRSTLQSVQTKRHEINKKLHPSQSPSIHNSQSYDIRVSKLRHNIKDLQNTLNQLKQLMINKETKN